MNVKFQRIVDRLLTNHWPEEVIRSVHSQEKKIRETKNIPHHNLVGTAKRKLEEVFDGAVHTKYARETLTAFEYAESHYHFLTGQSMLGAIVANHTIDFNDYQ